MTEKLITACFPMKSQMCKYLLVNFQLVLQPLLYCFDVTDMTIHIHKCLQHDMGCDSWGSPVKGHDQ